MTLKSSFTVSSPGVGGNIPCTPSPSGIPRYSNVAASPLPDESSSVKYGGRATPVGTGRLPRTDEAPCERVKV